nr:hypothetical protein BaRGS_018545 [Batillaria attramentaria]
MDKIAENRKKRQLALEASKQRGESSSSSDGCSDRKHRTQILECDSSKAEIDSTQDPAGTSVDTVDLLAEEVRIESLSLNESMDHSERFIANLVNFLKHIPDFRSLDGSVSYSEERDAWLKDNFEVPLSAYVGATQNPELMRRYADFCRITKRVLKNDISGYALLNLLVLLEPQTASLSDRQTVNTLHDKYATLLKHHLESQYSYMFAGQYLEAAWDCLHDSKLVAADMVSLFINFKDFIGPLMAEVMDMKPE